MTNLEASSSVATAPVGPPRSPWHSPVPYLFGGLAAMLGLIAFALLILACSYWKLSGHLDEENQQGDIEEGNNNNNNNSSNNNNVGDVKLVEKPILEEKFLVIMAGQLKPTYIATPSLSSRASSFGSSGSESSTEKSEGEEKEKEKEKEEKENNEGTPISGNDSSDNNVTQMQNN